jgi:hypothetical protein
MSIGGERDLSQTDSAGAGKAEAKRGPFQCLSGFCPAALAITVVFWRREVVPRYADQ